MPAAPTELTVTNISDTGASIQWSAVNGATSYTLYLATTAPYKNTSAKYNFKTDVPLTITLTSLTPATKYNVRVMATGDNGDGAPATTDFTTADADGLVIVGNNNKTIYAFSARTGAVAWRFTTGDQVLATPVIKDSVVYAGSFDGKLYALNVGDGSLKWATNKMRSGVGITAPVTISNGLIYLGDYGGWVYAFDTARGSEKWSYIIPSPYRNVNTAAVVSGDTTVYLGSYDGRVYALNALTGDFKWSTNTTGNPLSSGLALFNHTIYVGAWPKLYAFDAGTGAVKWRGYISGYELFDASPTISDNKVLLGDDDGVFYAFDAATGAIVWSRQLSSGSIMSSAVAVDGVVYVGGGDGVMYALNIATGNTIWSNNTLSTKNIYSGPTVSENYVYVATLEGNVYCMEKATGKIRWASTEVINQSFQSSPAVIKYSGKTFHSGTTGIVQ